MTTSGTDSWNPTITDTIKSAYRKLGVLGEDEDPTGGMFADAMFTANAMVKEWDASGIHVWTTEEAVLFLQPAQERYLLGAGSTDHYADANSWELLTLSATANAGAASVTVTDPTGVTNGQSIGIVLNTNATFWTTINAPPAGNVISFATPLPSIASAGAYSFAITPLLERPLRVPFARRLAFNGMITTPMTQLSHQEYQDLPNKAAAGISTQFFYRPRLVAGEFFVWPVPTNSENATPFTWLRQLQDFNDPSNTNDLPQEWANTIAWNLALEMSADFDIPEARFARIERMAAAKLDLVRGWDREPEAVQFSMETDQTAG